MLRQGEAVAVELVEGEIEKGETLLRGLPWIRGLRREGKRLHVGAPAERSRDVAEALAAAGIFPTELVRVSSTLEDLFLALTGGEGDG
jgi:hypothetical protein